VAGAHLLLARIVVAMLAVPLVLWFGVLARDARIGQEAVQRVKDEPSMSRDRWRQTMDELRQAELLNPGDEWTVHRAGWLLLRDWAEAERLARSVVRREPDNLAARNILRIVRGPDRDRAAALAARRAAEAGGSGAVLGGSGP
jgi:hypothetical protein